MSLSTEEAAYEFVFRWTERMKSEPGSLTPIFLLFKHPDLDIEDAETYLKFCHAHTIYHETCYGNGEIMWPKWQAWLAEVRAVSG